MPITRPTLTKAAETGVRDGSSQTATIGLGEVTVRRKLRVKWTESQKAAQHFLGWSRIVRDSGGIPQFLERLLPAPHPDDPALVATSLSVTNNFHWLNARGADGTQKGSRTNRLGDQTVGSEYKWLDFDITYERPFYQLKTDENTAINEEYKRYVDFGEPRPFTDVTTLPGHTVAYTIPTGTTGPAIFGGGTSAPIPGNVPLIQPGHDFPATWKRLPADFYNVEAPANQNPWFQRVMGDPNASTPIKPYMGSVNKTAFLQYPAGTLLFHEWKIIRRPAPFVLYTGGSYFSPTWLSPAVEWDVEMTFRYKPQGHNRLFLNDIKPPGSSASLKSGYYYVSRSKTYYAAGSVPDMDSLYNEREFRDLFKVQV